MWMLRGCFMFHTNHQVQQQEPTHVEIVDEFRQDFQQNDEQNSLEEGQHIGHDQPGLTLECSVNQQHGSYRQEPSEKYQTNVDTEKCFSRENDENIKINILSCGRRKFSLLLREIFAFFSLSLISSFFSGSGIASSSSCSSSSGVVSANDATVVDKNRVKADPDSSSKILEKISHFQPLKRFNLWTFLEDPCPVGRQQL